MARDNDGDNAMRRDGTDPHREQRAGGRYEQARGERERDKCRETEAAARERLTHTSTDSGTETKLE